MSGRSTEGLRPEVAFSFATAMVMIAQQVAGKATRDALFLSNFPATDLPYAMMAAAALSLSATLAFASARAAALGPARLVPIAFALSASLFAGEWILLQAFPLAAAVLVYLHMAVFGAILISGFWSVINERFDPYTAKSTVPKISAAAALGGVIGGVMASRVSALWGLPATLLGMAAMHVFCAFALHRVGLPSASSAETPAASRSIGPSDSGGLGLLARTPYLRSMAGLVALCAVVDGLLDYALKSEAATHFEPGELVQFFAVFYATTGGVAFLLQLSLGSTVLRRLGIGGALGVFPGLVAAGGLAAAMVGRFWGVVALRAGATLTSTSLYRAGFELLYTPVPEAVKRRTKVLIDVGATRFGDLMAGGLLLVVLALLPNLASSTFAGIAAAAAAAALFLIVRLNRGYIAELASKLRAGDIRIRSEDALDATTARTLAATGVSFDRESLLAEIRRREAAKESREGDVSDAPSDTLGTVPLPTDVAACVGLLQSRNNEQILSFLSHGARDTRLSGFVLDLLRDPAQVDAATRYLRWIADRIPGELGDAMLDREREMLVRRRIPRILEVSENERALEALSQGMRAAEFEIRFRCAQAATRVVARMPTLRLDEARADEIALAELSLDDETWRRLSLRGAGQAGGSVLLSRKSLKKIPRTVEHVFTVLALARERQILASTLGALYGGDPMIRGTALEYLETVLPDELCAKLFARLDTRVDPPPKPRDRDSIESDLMRSSADIVVDPSQVSELFQLAKDDEG